MNLGRGRLRAGFSLLEVMIALAIFFMAAFAILQSTSQSLGAARMLKQSTPDALSLIAELSLTNRLEEGVVEGDFGDLYPDFKWRRETVLVATNGLFQIDFKITGFLGKRAVESSSSLLLWRPDSRTSSYGRSL
jgi:prepilin-type N-terminal cleavage/methylation domain-containing protein